MNPKALIERIEDWYLADKQAQYGLSFSRILIGAALLGILITNLGTRYVLWGPGSQWAAGIRESSTFGGLNQIFSTASPLLFTAQYVLLMALAVAVIVGWRTRVCSVLLLVGMTALVERNPMVGDQGDNIARIGLIWLILTTASTHWSLDARRRRRASMGRSPSNLVTKLFAGLSVLPPWCGALIHNVALTGLALQVFVLYLASALYKVQGELWQNGTALYYPLSLHEYGVFPWLNQLLTGWGPGVTVATYFAVFVQLFFAPALLHPFTRRIAVLAVILMHLGIAVLMGLPWFSLSMIAFDGIFVAGSTYQRIDARARRTAGSILARVLRTRAGAWLPAPQHLTNS